jgi:ubiquinone/menaquinone biosynthesis C-methylase UbiE
MSRTLAGVLLATITLIAPGTGCQGQTHDEAAARQPANVMSWRGASWLERPERASEDRPDIVIRSMDLENGDTVAEIGAGTGFFTRRLATEVAPEGVVWANDIQPEMLELMREYLARDGISNVRQVLGEEDDPRLPADTFDWVLMVDVYHEFQQPVPMLEKIHAALKPDGRVALVEYRAEDESAAHIMPSHRMSKKQVLAEWVPAGFVLVKTVDELPSQHLFIFRKR